MALDKNIRVVEGLVETDTYPKEHLDVYTITKEEGALTTLAHLTFASLKFI